MKEDTLYEIIAKVLSGNAGKDDEFLLQEWRKKHDDNEALFNDLKSYWEAGNLKIERDLYFDKDSIWSTIKSKTFVNKEKNIYPKRSIFLISAAAACIAILLTMSISFLFQEQIYEATSELQNTEIIVPSGQKTQLILPDGSKVWLNSDSRLVYSNRYNKSNRRVQLEGEGFFEVVKNEDKKFIAVVDDVEIEVTGTSFNVNNYPEDNILYVSLMEGGVNLYSRKDHVLLTELKPNQEVRISKTDLSYKIVASNTDAEAIWRNNVLKFEGATAEEMFKKIERWYGVHITCSSKMPDRHYWFTIKTESLTEILQSINWLTPMEFVVKGEEVTINFK